jgi:hypothetical protein
MFEIRNYHYAPDKIEAYKQWAVEHAIPFLSSHLTLIGFWIGNNSAPELSGKVPMSLPLGSANVTWIIEWDSMETRNNFRNEILTGHEWLNIKSLLPSIDGYLQIESRFTDNFI